jgi:hypothetical protein
MSGSAAHDCIAAINMQERTRMVTFNRVGTILISTACSLTPAQFEDAGDDTQLYRLEKTERCSLLSTQIRLQVVPRRTL